MRPVSIKLDEVKIFKENLRWLQNFRKAATMPSEESVFFTELKFQIQ